MADGDGGTERRIQDAAAIASMAVQIGNLATAMIRVEAGQSMLLQRLEATEQRSHENCRTCTTWTRLSELEKKDAANAERLKKVDDHESRLRFLELRVVSAAGALSAAIWAFDRFVLK